MAIYLEELIGYDADQKAQKKILVDTQEELNERSDLGIGSIALVRSASAGSRVKLLSNTGWEVL